MASHTDPSPSLLHQDCGVRVVSLHPERVDDILAVAGVPGDTFSTMLAPLRLPRPIAKQVMINIARASYSGGNALAPVIKRIPWTNLTTGAVQRVGFISREADTDHLRIMLREFCTTKPRWYAHLALGVSQGTRVRLSGIRVPVTFIAARNDILTGARDMLSASKRRRGPPALGDRKHSVTDND